MKRAKRAVSGILSGAILFGILFTTVATYFTTVQESNQLIQTQTLRRVEALKELKQEAMRIDGNLGANSFMFANVTNLGGSPSRIVQMFVVAPNGSMLRNVVASPLPRTINQGGFYAINSTVKYVNGTYWFRVITERGTVGTGQYPPPPVPLAQVSVQQIENVTVSITTKAIGKLLIDFESFQFCGPNPTTCTSDSNFQSGWKVDTGKKYLFRIKIKNTSNQTLFFDSQTAILMLQSQEGGGGNMPSDMYIRNAPNATFPTGSAYTNNYKFKLPPDNAYYWMYIGSDTVAGTTLQTMPAAGIYSISLIVFAYFDVNGNGTYQPTIDTKPYSQNIPFQGMRIL